jgi:glycosyltransferase involved in cell wall biosynthesis
MRTLLVDLGRDYRGGQDQALQLVKGLKGQGHTPELIAIRGSLLVQRAQRAGISVHPVDKRWRIFAAAFVIRQLLSGRSIEIVHANEPHALTAAWLARAHHRVPLVAARRVIFPLSKSALAQRRYRAAEKIVAVSECVSSALAHSGIEPGKIAVIPDGVPLENSVSQADRERARQTFGIEPDVLVIGSVGALTPDKGQEILIRAFARIRLRFPDCQLLLPGDGPCRAKLAAVVQDLDLDGAVHFPGFVEDVGRVYAAIDLFAFLAQAEALGTSLLIAMSYGLPIVAAARGGIPEVVEHEKNGLLLKDSTPEAVASAVERLLEDRKAAAHLGSAAKETIHSRFSREIMVSQTLKLYEQLLVARASAYGG